jgi:hypothetical protein
MNKQAKTILFECTVEIIAVVASFVVVCVQALSIVC